MAELVPVGILLAPGRHRIVGATRVVEPVVVASGHGLLVVEGGDDRLVVSVR